MSLEDVIRKKEEELQELKRKQVEHDALPDDKKLAIALHKLLCRWNHVDGCGWYYASNWDEFSRSEYLLRAQNLLANTEHTPDQILEVLRLAGV